MRTGTVRERAGPECRAWGIDLILRTWQPLRGLRSRMTCSEWSFRKGIVATVQTMGAEWSECRARSQRPVWRPTPLTGNISTGAQQSFKSSPPPPPTPHVVYLLLLCPVDGAETKNREIKSLVQGHTGSGSLRILTTSAA